MKKETKDKWLAALRSGDYRQTDSRLRASLRPVISDVSECIQLDEEEASEIPEDALDGYCCLGVLCDILRPDGWYHQRTTWETDNGHGYEVELAAWEHVFGTAGDLLNSDSLIAEISIDPLRTDLDKSKTAMMYLANLNDGGADFNAIADWIEANVTVTP